MSFGAAIYEIYSLEQFAGGASPVHTTDARVKVVCAFAYIAAVTSFGSREISALVPFALYPAFVLSLASVPLSLVFKRSMTALPFCLFAGASSLFFDRDVLFSFGSFAVTGGLITFASVILRATLCASAVLTLVAVTPFREITSALRFFHMPGVFVSLLELTYRYIGVLTEEACSVYAAYSLRGARGRGVAVRDFGAFTGRLLLRAFERAERVCQAMKCRGYNGSLPEPLPERRLSRRDVVFLAAGVFFVLFFRFVNVSRAVGEYALSLW